MELAIVFALRPPLSQKVTRTIEHLYPVIMGVSHIDVAARVNGNALWVIEFAIARTLRPPLSQEVARTIEDLYLVASVVNHINKVILLDFF